MQVWTFAPDFCTLKLHLQLDVGCDGDVVVEHAVYSGQQDSLFWCTSGSQQRGKKGTWDVFVLTRFTHSELSIFYF